MLTSPFQCIKWKVTLSLLNKLHLRLMRYHDYCLVNTYLITLVLVGEWNELLNPFFLHMQESPGGELSSPLTPVTPPMESINGTDEICDTTPNSDSLPGPAQNALAFAHRYISPHDVFTVAGSCLLQDRIYSVSLWSSHSHIRRGRRHRQRVKQARLTSDNICTCSIGAG